MRSTCPIHFNLFVLIVLTTLREECKIHDSSMWSFLQLFRNIFPLRFKHRVPKHNTSIYVLPLRCDSSSYTNRRDRKSNSVLYILTNLHRYQNQSGGAGSIPDHSLVGILAVRRLFSECFGFHSATAPYSFTYLSPTLLNLSRNN